MSFLSLTLSHRRRAACLTLWQPTPTRAILTLHTITKQPPPPTLLRPWLARTLRAIPISVTQLTIRNPRLKICYDVNIAYEHH